VLESICLCYTFSHLKRLFYSAKIRKNVKSIVGISPTMVLLFHLPFLLFEDVKDEMWKHNGRSCFSIQHCVSFIMFMEEFASRVLNTIFLFSQLTQSEQTKKSPLAELNRRQFDLQLLLQSNALPTELSRDANNISKT
jgi:hypothetical protein